jgi:hypothetical protein
MKEPKYVLQIAGQQFVVPSDQGISTLIRMMEDVVPVHADLRERKIELTYTDRGEEEYLMMLEFFREVRIRKIPAGVKWSRKAPDGSVQEVRVVAKKAQALPPSKTKALPPNKVKALPPPSNQLALL